MIDFVAIETALRTWLGAATGAVVIFADQDGPQPPLPYLTLGLPGLRREGGADELRDETELKAPAGQEVVLSTYGPRELTAHCQAFTAPTTGVGTARELLQQAQSALGRPDVLEQLAQVGLAVIDEGAVTVLNLVLETRFQGRAALDVRLRVTDGSASRTGYIETVSVAPAP